MENITEVQREDIKKMSTSRLKLKLLTAGFSDEDVESFDRPTCLTKWAELISRGVDQPLPSTPQSSVYDVELERERLRWEQVKHDEEMRLRERELALKRRNCIHPEN